MKISEWKDLDGYGANGIKLLTQSKYISVIRQNDNSPCGKCVMAIYFDDFSKDEILKILSAFGFEVEFEKPKITRWELAKKEDKGIDVLLSEFNIWCAKHTHSSCAVDSCRMCMVSWLKELVPVEGE